MEKFKAHILVVDDDDGIRELVKEYLLQNNYLYLHYFLIVQLLVIPS